MAVCCECDVSNAMLWQFLSGLAQVQPDWSLLARPHAAELPAHRWKLANIQTFKERLPVDFERQAKKLDELLKLPCSCFRRDRAFCSPPMTVSSRLRAVGYHSSNSSLCEHWVGCLSAVIHQGRQSTQSGIPPSQTYRLKANIKGDGPLRSGGRLKCSDCDRC